MGIFDFFKKKNKKEYIFQNEVNIKDYEEDINNTADQYEYEDEKYLTSNKISIMSKFYERLDKLSRKYETDLDIISLNALCATGINEENEQAITNIIERLENKYPDEKEIMWLNLKVVTELEEIYLEDLLEELEKKYLGNSEVITIRALINLPNTVERDKSIIECLKRLRFEIEEKNIDMYFSYLAYTEQISMEECDELFLEIEVYGK